MKRKARSTAAACACLISLTALLSCTRSEDWEIHADESPQALAETWGIEVPESMVTTKFYSSDVGFQGDGDFIRELKLPEQDQTGRWSPEAFQEPVDTALADTVISESGAELTTAQLSHARCRPTLNKDDYDRLMLCYDAATQTYYAFESLF